jgi:hypothetical protein
MPEQWNKFVILPIYKKGDKSDYSNYQQIPLLSNYVQDFIQHSLKVKSFIGNFIGDHQCGF